MTYPNEERGADDLIYRIWLSLKPSMTPARSARLLGALGSARAVYEEKSFDGLLPAAERLTAELNDKSTRAAERALERMREIGGRVITIGDGEYPDCLKEIYAAPPVLYALGQRLGGADEFRIAVVGTRKCTAYGKRAAEKLSKELAENGVVIVSGMAYGIDTFAANAALAVGQKTVAVLGSGADVPYPSANKGLYEAIAENGTVISEYPPGTKPFSYHFPARNRIIAGLSRGTLVVQAPMKSGALITANYALENNRDVFAVPGDMFDINQEGTNELIKSGAKCVTRAEDILEEYGSAAAAKGKADRLEGADMSGLDETERAILRLLGGTRLHADEISRSVGASEAEVGTALMMLELGGRVVKDEANIYDLK